MSAEQRVRGPTEVVAIDGPSGAGKSTIARELARRLGYSYLDTGAMYRAVTWHFLEQQCAPAQLAGDPGAERRMRDVLAHTELAVLPDGRVLLNGRDVSGHLRSREVEHQVSAVSALPFVREAMRELQRKVAAAGPLVAEGRDMTTVVFPDARWKVYLDARPEERARRRHKDFAGRGRDVTERDVLEEIEVRDRLDSTRVDAPLVRAKDAHYLDTTGLDAGAVLAALLTWIGRTDRSAGRGR